MGTSDLSLSILTTIFPGEPGLTSFVAAKDDGNGGDNWSYETCKAPVKSSPPTNQHPTFYRPMMPFLSPNRQCRSTQWNNVTLYTIQFAMCNCISWLLIRRWCCAGKGKGTPALRRGIHCIGIDVEDESEHSDWQGFEWCTLYCRNACQESSNASFPAAIQFGARIVQN